MPNTDTSAGEMYAEGHKKSGNPFRFGGKEGHSQILFPWPCNS